MLGDDLSLVDPWNKVIVTLKVNLIVLFIVEGFLSEATCKSLTCTLHEANELELVLKSKLSEQGQVYVSGQQVTKNGDEVTLAVMRQLRMFYFLKHCCGNFRLQSRPGGSRESVFQKVTKQRLSLAIVCRLQP